MKYESKSYKAFKVLDVVILLLIAFITLFPFIYLFSISFSSSKAVLAGGVNFYPVDFNWGAYKGILEQSNFWLGYKNTIIYTVFGTLISLFMTIICAYPLSKKNLVGSSIFLKLIVFTMFFGGGLIPTYLLIQKIGLVNTRYAILLPGAINAYNVLIMKTFFQGLPESLEEAAKIDGLNQIGVLIKIVLPLSKPIIATITLFISVGFWNDWFSSLIFLNNDKLYPVTLFLRNIIMGTTMASKSGQTMDASSAQSLPQTLQAAATMLVVLPILCVYPFVQKYFVQGVMIGSIKG
ncbi:carbohydrate ABC transporter permease [Clostridium grantii]|uniref:Putative aldouronate transport system permease protein n=1 Tax=Clostridium grantii DSM 8605 TaxID=1121316 RepID=A0A1M5WA95_9CLOT|nr:carbohydrate ABC transporter permease [Clostridium grantii]SHH84387.1 putative aldouronate transport system permease protein [Clostridium grantii DSM 8605]